jgi:hypothetical protein
MITVLPKMSPLTDVYEVLWGLVDPWIFMGMSGSWIPQTVMDLVRQRQFGVLISPSRFQDAWFGNFWGYAGPNVKLNAEQRVIPLLDGRTQGGRIVDET